MFPWECCLQVKLSMPIPAFHSLLSRPPATATGAAEAAKEKVQRELNIKFRAYSLHPSSAVLLREIGVTSSASAAEEQQERMKGE